MAENKVVYTVEYIASTYIPDDDDYGNTRMKEYIDTKVVYPYYFESVEKVREFIQQTKEFKAKEGKFLECSFKGIDVYSFYSYFDSENDKSYTFNVRPLSLWWERLYFLRRNKYMNYDKFITAALREIPLRLYFLIM